MKYFYLSQSDLNYFLQIRGNVSIISETNKASFSINDNSISLLGMMRNRRYEHYSVTSSTKVDIDFELSKLREILGEKHQISTIDLAFVYDLCDKYIKNKF